MLVVRQLLFKGKSSFMRQLHDFDAMVDVLVLRIFLLCLLMMEAMFSVQL